MPSNGGVNGVIVDFETTSLDWNEARIVEIGTWKFSLEDWEIARPDHTIKQFVSLGDMKIPESTTKVTGIEDRHLRGSPGEKEALEMMIDAMFGDGTEVAFAHNAYYDAGVLWWACRRNKISMPRIRFHDTLEMFRIAFGEAKSHRLEKLVDVLGISVPRSHRAQNDCMATYEIMKVAADRLGVGPSDLTSVMHGIPSSPLTLGDIRFVRGDESSYWVRIGGTA